MFDKSAIEALTESKAIAEAAAAVTKAFDHNHGAAALPENITLRDLEKFMPVRRRPRGVMTTSSVTDFATYIGQHKQEGATVFVSHKQMHATAVLDLGVPELPGHAENTAYLVPKMTAAYQALLAIAAIASVEQARAAEFLEDWSECIKCLDGEAPLQTKHAIAAVRSITIEGMRRIESNEEQLSASKSSFESVKATSRTALPTRIAFLCIPYAGFEPRTFALRLGIRTGSDKPTLTLRAINQEQQNEQMAIELGTKVQAALSESLPVLIGEYTAK